VANSSLHFRLQDRRPADAATLSGLDASVANDASRRRFPPKISIGKAKRMFGLTARAIRLYEEKGLIVARRDGKNWRYYDGLALQRLRWISVLKTAELTLADIKDVIAAEERDGSGLRCAVLKLHARRDEIETSLAKVDLMIARLDTAQIPAQATLR
jgi:DNA-binding transcriptional MerR regulator